MLYLSRKVGEAIIINNEINITISEIKGNKYVKIGCEFPPHVTILRKEIHDKISNENLLASKVDIEIIKQLIKRHNSDNN